MTNKINHYLAGMIVWGELSYEDQVWVWLNRVEFCPASARLSFMGQ